VRHDDASVHREVDKVKVKLRSGVAPVRREFDPRVLDSIVQDTIRWRQHTGIGRYPGRIQWPTKWLLRHRPDTEAIPRAQLDRFEPVRRRWDPDGLFVNDFLGALFK
jgi:hypothetical protein